MQELPRVRKGILTPAEGISDQQDAGSIRDRVNISYARDYSIFKDLIIMLRGWKKLGRAPVELYMN